jgi:Putative beta barrel porin-7 (BBP7)
MKRTQLSILLILAVGTGKCLAQAPEPLEPLPYTGSGLTVAPSEGDTPRVWGSADYLLWWVRKAGVPPLVTTGSPDDTFPGLLGQPHTEILFGNHGIDYGAFSGMRATAGAWVDSDGTLGFEAGGFALERRSVQYSASGGANGQIYLAAPFINALSGHENAYAISQNFADPNLSDLLTGGVNVFSATRLWGWEANGVANLARDGGWTVDVIAGFRQLSLREDLSYVTASSNIVAGGASEFLGAITGPGEIVATYDHFGTQNLFNGGQVGARIGGRFGLLTLDVSGKVALGSMHEGVTIQGVTTTNAALPVTTAPGGIFAQSSNSGHFTHNTFAVIPEAGVNLGVELTPNIHARVGYTFLYVSSVVQPGNQIDRVINPNRVPIDQGFGTPGGPNRPTIDLKTTDFWAQGLNFGLEFKF